MGRKRIELDFRERISAFISNGGTVSLVVEPGNSDKERKILAAELEKECESLWKPAGLGKGQAGIRQMLDATLDGMGEEDVSGCFLARGKRGQLLGLLTYQDVEFEGGEKGRWVVSVGTTGKVMGTGVALMGAVAEGVERLELDSSDAARAFYQGLGFIANRWAREETMELSGSRLVSFQMATRDRGEKEI